MPVDPAGAHLRHDGSTDGLSPDRCGARRGSGLTDPERELYRRLLRRFAAGGAPDPGEVDSEARTLGVVAEDALRHMEELDLVRLDERGAVVCAYPFSAIHTGHDVELDGAGRRVHAMCALDALGIPQMLHRGGVVHSADPVTGRPLTVRVEADGTARAEPSGVSLVVAHLGAGGPLAISCCPLLNLFSPPRRRTPTFGATPRRVASSWGSPRRSRWRERCSAGCSTEGLSARGAGGIALSP